MSNDQITYLINLNIFTSIDYHFARFITRLCGTEDLDVFLAAALVSNATGAGHVCLDLEAAADTVIVENADGRQGIKCPPLAAWEAKLLKTPVVGKTGDFCPLVLDSRHRLYLNRYRQYENRLASAIMERVVQPADVDLDLLKIGLSRLFRSRPAEGVDWQKIASAVAVVKRFCVVSGGPGTGKTYTVARILALLLEQARDKNFRIFLCSPTGKAAAKLKEAVMRAKEDLDCPWQIKTAIPEETYTIHRMLKPVSGSSRFRHSAENPIPADLVLVDEASMVDLALMAKLAAALPPEARLILMGDMDQLASVEAGSVLGDICGRGVPRRFSSPFLKSLHALTGEPIAGETAGFDAANGLQDCIVTLKNSHRFSGDTGIAALSRIINQGDVDAMETLLRQGPSTSRIEWKNVDTAARCYGILEKHVIQGYSAYLKADRPANTLDLFSRFRILCAVNKGPFGVDAVNAFVEKILARRQLIVPNTPWYRGKPILITRNDYRLGLFNGDVGIVLADPDSARNDMAAFFEGFGEDIKRVAPGRIAGYETAYALTVHKSQGSEFDHVLLVIPDRWNPVLTRELLYTGITRARESLCIVGPLSVLQAAVKRRIERTSGLKDVLWNSDQRA